MGAWGDQVLWCKNVWFRVFRTLNGRFLNGENVLKVDIHEQGVILIGLINQPY